MLDIANATTAVGPVGPGALYSILDYSNIFREALGPSTNEMRLKILRVVEQGVFLNLKIMS